MLLTSTNRYISAIITVRYLQKNSMLIFLSLMYSLQLLSDLESADPAVP